MAVDSEPLRISITPEYLAERRKHEEEERKNWLARPTIWTEQFPIDNQVIELMNFNPNFEWTSKHKYELSEFVQKAREINPILLQRFKRMTFEKDQPVSVYGDEERFPINGTVRRDVGAVILFPRGQRSDIPHRIPSISNFQGTLAHEVFHFGDEDYTNKWDRKFGWNYCYNFLDEWERVEGTDRTWKNIQTGEIHISNQFTRRPELCLNDYTRLQWQEDYADSGVATVLAPQLLIDLCRDKYDAIRDGSTIDR